MPNSTFTKVEACKAITKNKQKYAGSAFRIKITDLSGNELAHLEVAAESFYLYMADGLNKAVRDDLNLRRALIQKEMREINDFLK